MVDPSVKDSLSALSQENTELKAQLASCREALEHIRQAELRYRQIFENSPISMMICNREGYITEMNEAAEAFYGLTVSQLNQQVAPIFNNPQLIENGTLPYMTRALAGEAVIEPPTYYDAIGHIVQGNLTKGRGHYAPIRDEVGDVEAFVEICPDYRDFFILQAQLLEAAERAAQEREQAAEQRAEELEAYTQRLQGRDRILEATAAASKILLTEPNFEMAISEALGILGDSIGCDRIMVGQQFDDPEKKTLGFVRFLYEWNSSATSSQLNDHEGLTDFYWHEIGLEDWYHANARGEIIGQTIDELSERFRQSQEQIGVQATYSVPIFVDDQFWGVIAVDHCCEKRLLTEAEQMAFKTAANFVGSAIERDRDRRAKAEAERQVLLERERAAQMRAAQLQERNHILSLQERWLKATTAAATELLSTDDLERAIASALQMLGEGVGVDRVTILKYVREADHCFVRVAYEWTTPDQPTQITHQDLQDIPWEDVGEFADPLLEGEWIGGDIDQFREPFRSGQIELGVQSTYAVPIFVEGRFWGAVGIDHCRQKKLLTDAEIAVFQIFASCFGSAIQGHQMQQARETAERKALVSRERAARAAELEAANQVLITRDRWLETTAIAAHQLLSNGDIETSVQVALKTIGENLGCDRVVVMRYLPHPDTLGSMRILYEWDAQGISAQSHNPDLCEIPSDGIETWFQQILAGSWVGGIVEELDEPFRSSQQQLGVKSTYGAPVFVEEQLWGIVGIDYCCEAKRLSSAEIAVFETAATCIGSAIYQEAVRRDRAAQERAKLLSSVAEAANLLLRSSDYKIVLPDVVRLLGAAVGSDRCTIVTAETVPVKLTSSIQFAAEWCRPTVQHGYEATPDLESKTWQDFPELYDRLLQVETANYLVTDLSEPNRSLFTAQGIRSVAYLPIIVNGEPWGQIGFDNCGDPRLYSEAEIAILQVAAESIAAAIARQAQDEALRASEEHYRTLFEISSEGIYRFEYDHPIPLALPIEEQVKLVYERCLITEGNQTYAEMYGFDQTKDVVGIWLKNLHVLESDQNLNFLRTLVEGKHQIQNYESEERDRHGNPLYLLNNIATEIKDGCAIGGWGSQLDITELRSAQEALADERIRAETELIRERTRIAQDIHDTLAQSFGGILMQLQAANYFAKSNPDKSHQHFLTARDLAKEGLSEARKSVWALYEESREYQDLSATATEVVHQLTARSNLDVQVVIEGEPYLIDPDVGLNMLRIVQEAATNVVRHAQADTFTLRVIYAPQQIDLLIRDDGIGFDPSLPIKGFGLSGMQQRCDRIGAEFHLTSQPGIGTTVRVSYSLTTVPIPTG